MEFHNKSQWGVEFFSILVTLDHSLSSQIYLNISQKCLVKSVLFKFNHIEIEKNITDLNLVWVLMEFLTDCCDNEQNWVESFLVFVF